MPIAQFQTRTGGMGQTLNLATRMKTNSDPTELSVLLIDGGQFLSLAFRLAKDFKRVCVYSPTCRPTRTLADAVVGDGFNSIERIEDLWSELRHIDIVVIPDIGYADLAKQLVSLNVPLWSSRAADKLEIDRSFLKQWQGVVGMDIPPFTRVKGLDNLRDYLRDNDNVYVKISRYRGDMETFHSINYELSLPFLDELAVRWGPVQNDIAFIVEDAVDAIVETGYDGFNINGIFPKFGIQGIEQKDKAYIGTVTEYDQFPNELLEVNDKLAGWLNQNQYRNFVSTEVRITEDKKVYLTDPTMRMPSPAGESQLDLITNLSEIIVAGSQGELIEPEYSHKFSVQAFIDHTQPKNLWRLLNVAEDQMDGLYFRYCCQVDGSLAFPPFEWLDETVGTVVGLGDTLEDALSDLKTKAEILDGQDVIVHVEAVADCLKSIQEAEKADIPFTDQEVPEPATVIET